MNTDRAAQVLNTTLTVLKASTLRHMPDCGFRDFYLWALSEENAHQNVWLDVIGVRQTVHLTLELLDGLVDEQHWNRLAEFSIPLNIYLAFEAVSDNLAIGLANQALNDHTYLARRELLQGFNHAMIRRLNGKTQSAADLLRPMQPVAERISGSEYSLNPQKYRSVTDEYLRWNRGPTRADLAFSVWPILVANIEACNDLSQSTASYRAGALVHQGLVARYRAVNDLLEDNVILPRRAHVGADAVLAMPVLAYYASCLEEVIWQQDSFASLIEDGILIEALFSAAMLVRLVNDLGTSLVTQTEQQRVSFMEGLKSQYLEQHLTAQTLTALLLNPADDVRHLLARLRKDLVNGEFNVCLYGFSDTLPVSATLAVFEQRLAYLSQLYLQCRARLKVALEIMTERLDNDALSHLIRRFVQFHEVLYGRLSTEPLNSCAI